MRVQPFENIRDPRNTSRDWRNDRDRLGYPAVTTQSFRKAIATAPEAIIE